jgi:hypothetical protein
MYISDALKQAMYKGPENKAARNIYVAEEMKSFVAPSFDEDWWPSCWMIFYLLGMPAGK